MHMNRLVEIGREHWKEFLPHLYRELVAARRLERALQLAADHTRREMNSLVAHGYQEHEAWAMVRQRYLILKPETNSKENDDEQPDHSLAKSLVELTDLRNRIRSGEFE